ncbi:MAG: M1 family metallopeptidase [Myxococcota bacterium]
MQNLPFVILALLLASSAQAEDKFRQLEEILPTPDELRLGSGVPGPAYWQQRVDYSIDVTLDEKKHRVTGSEKIRYGNRSPHVLPYLWVQLDNNIAARGSDKQLTELAPGFDKFAFSRLARELEYEKFDGGIKLTKVVDAAGKELPYTVVGTMMRIDLPAPLQPKGEFSFQIDWSYTVNDLKKFNMRTGYEELRDGNDLFSIAHWYPRMAAYTDVNGWQNKQFIGSGEFTLEFGDFDVRITVPKDHVVAATGTLQNPDDVLTDTQKRRLEQAETAKNPVMIITEDEATAAGKKRAKGTRTWTFRAENVRDFAWASSRSLMWDAIRYKKDGNNVLAMSYWPPEGEPLWSRYSTRAVVHTIDVYSRHTFAYPYPVAISVNSIVGGMEYPMICFNAPRPFEDKTYYGPTDREITNSFRHSKYGLISVIIHEVGHNFFPMIVNSDERQWTWMDEGLNTFLQFLAEQEWEEDYPSRRGMPEKIVDYMTSEDQVPIMTNSESILQFGNNAYGKPATALNILRETVMGRELFDFAFKHYSQSWKFRRPMPADFFRAMEDASAVDLDWFWRGWFYSTDHVDIAIAEVKEFILDSSNPDRDKAALKKERDSKTPTITEQRNARVRRLVDRYPDLKDFYNSYDPLDVTKQDREAFKKMLETLTPQERGLLGTARHFYVVRFENQGGVPMPIPLEITYEDGSTEFMRIPAEIWRKNTKDAKKLFMRFKRIASLHFDPNRETADADMDDNQWPPQIQPSRFKLYKKTKDNAMREAQEE